MTYLSTQLKKDILNWYFRIRSVEPPSPPFLGLLRSTPTGDTTFLEVDNEDYERIPVSDWNLSNDGTYVSNAEDLEFATTTTHWGTVLEWALFSRVRDGELVGSGPLGQSITIPIGYTLPIPRGVLKVKVT